MRSNWKLIFLFVGFLSCHEYVRATSVSVFDCLMEPAQTVEVSSPVVGLLDKVHVRRGDRVSKGQLLASLDSRVEVASAALAKYKSEVSGPSQAAKARIDFSKKKYERRKEMAADHFLSQQETDDAEAEWKQAESDLLVAVENREIAKIEHEQQTGLLSLRTMRSPFDGVVVDQLLFPGEVVEPTGQKKAILRIAQIHPVKVRVVLPMGKFGQIKVGGQLNVIPESPFSGKYAGIVRSADRIVNASSGTFAVFLEISNAKADVPVGVKCRVDVGS